MSDKNSNDQQDNELCMYFNQANIYLFKVNDRSTRKRCEICSKLTIKTQERRHCPANIYLFKVNKKYTTKRCGIRSKLTIKITERHLLVQTNPSVFDHFVKLAIKGLTIR